MDRRMEEDMDTKMDLGDLDEVVTIESDDSSDGEELADVIPVPPAAAGSRRVRKNARRGPPSNPNIQSQPMVVDLTKDEDSDEDDDEIMITDNPEEETKAADDGDMPELIEVKRRTLPPAIDVAEERKKKGNDHFKLGQYYQALDMYSQAITAMPTEASYYGNRSACNMMLKRYREALADIRKSLQLDPTYEKGYLRLIRTTLVLGNIKECEIGYETIKKNNLNVEVKTEYERLQWLKKQMVEIEATKAKKDFRKLVYLTSQGLDVASANNDLKMLKADSLLRLGRHSEAQELCTEVLQNDLRCPEALYIRAMCLYLDDNLDKSIQFVRQGLQFAPDNSSCQNLFKKLRQLKELREAAGVKFQGFRFEEAKADYMQCLTLVTEGDISNVTIESKLYFNLALIANKQNKIDESLEACTKAIDLNPKYIKAIIHRSKIYTQKEMHDDAIHDLEAALRIDPNVKSLKKDLQDAKMAAKRAKRKDYYKILNVEKTASDDEIRKAYKKRALVHHPDRHASATEAVQKEQERLFKDLGEAYEVLSDPKKRFRYDQGVDLMDDSRGGYDTSGYDSSDFINIFFGNSGIPQFRPGQTAGARAGAGPNQYHYTFRH